ncbi:MAG TPA: ABC transporter ATP-binding protein [Noviherbaspirillum sp.]|nr:ABC transporter ATP-binding protein [Noviherbaspirillum sp.]
MHKPLLSIQQLRAWYGPSQALHGVSLDVREGELVTLLGRNGAGKTTLLKAIMGMVGRVEGSIRYRGFELVGDAPHHIARAGIGYCPDDRGIYASLTVRENLLLPPVVSEGGMSEEEIFQLFPNLAERANSPGTKLSGGEQQMLAIARILRTGARLLLLDEPTEGLAPVIVQRIGELLQQLKARGYTILLVEQNVEFAAELADRHYLIETGRVAAEYDALTLAHDFDRVAARLGV